jgi:choline dehydrogenase
MSARLITNPAASWLYFSQPEVNTNGRRIPVPRGKLPGGSSAINGMAFVRSQAQDFRHLGADGKARAGATKTSWSPPPIAPVARRLRGD